MRTLLLAVLWLAGARPAPAAANDRPSPAAECLLVIDMQNQLFEMKQPVYKAEDLVLAVSNAIRSARRDGLPVIYTQHENKVSLHPGSAGWRIHPDLAPAPEDPIIRKRHPGVFKDTPLESFLRERGITRVRVCGLISNGCIKDACLDALALGFDVILIDNGHSTFFQNAPRLIADWNTLLAGKGVTLRSE